MPLLYAATASLGPQYAVYDEATGKNVAIVYAGDEAEATARTFAAAPDMLKALLEIVNEPCNHGPGFCPRKVAIATLQGAGVLP